MRALVPQELLDVPVSVDVIDGAELAQAGVETLGEALRLVAGISVRDTGPGIPAEFLDKIFDPFFRITQSRTAVKGLGLGLSIVRTLVELHGGIAHAEIAGKGQLPVRVSLGNRVQTAPGSVPRILVVDDDKDIRELLEDRLRARGYQVETETDGLRALDAIHSGRFSGLILDIGLPSLDGMEVLKQIRQKDQQMPIIMVSASGAKESAVRAIGLGAQAYLLKPFDVDELHQVMESCFRTVL